MGKLGVIIVAAGTGSRMRTTISKQYLQLANKPVLVHTLEVFEQIEALCEIVVVTGPSDIERINTYIAQYQLHKVKQVVIGGADRQASVYHGLRALSAGIEWVLIHDGVRPLVTSDLITNCWEAAQETGAAVAAVPMKDTIKQVNEEDHIVATLQRESLRAVQTPQAFRRSLIVKAHQQAYEKGWTGTDDAALVEALGHPVKVVAGDYRNLKLTTPEDLAIAALFLEARDQS